MKFYQVFDQKDAAASDSWFPTLKAAHEHIRESYGWPKPDGVELVVREVKGKLTKERICSLLTNWPQR